MQREPNTPGLRVEEGVCVLIEDKHATTFSKEIESTSDDWASLVNTTKREEEVK